MTYAVAVFMCLLVGQVWLIPVAVALVAWLSSTEADIAQEIAHDCPSSPWGVLARMAVVCLVVAGFFFVLLAVWVGGEL